MKVKEYRKAKGLSQDDMAELLGIKQSAYSKKENGKLGFSAEEMLLLEDILEASISELFKELKEKLIKDKLMKK